MRKIIFPLFTSLLASAVIATSCGQDVLPSKEASTSSLEGLTPVNTEAVADFGWISSEGNEIRDYELAWEAKQVLAEKIRDFGGVSSWIPEFVRFTTNISIQDGCEYYWRGYFCKDTFTLRVALSVSLGEEVIATETRSFPFTGVKSRPLKLRLGDAMDLLLHLHDRSGALAEAGLDGSGRPPHTPYY